MHGNGPFFNRMGFNPFCPFFCPFFINTILTVEAKNGPLNGETLNGLKDVKCEQTFTIQRYSRITATNRVSKFHECSIMPKVVQW